MPLALFECFALLAGYPPAALTVSLGAGIYLMLRLPWQPRGAALAARAIGAGALAVGIVLAAPVLVPFADALRESATLADRGDGGQWTLANSLLRLFWNPYAFGSPLLRAATPWNGPENFEEAQQYIGLVPWVFLVAFAPALVRARGEDRLRSAALAVIAVVALSLGFGWQPLHALITLVPPFSVNANPRLLFLAQVAIPLLAALGARAWRRANTVPASRGLAVAPLAALVAIGATLLVTLAVAARWELRAWVALGSALALALAFVCAASAGQRRLVAALVPLLWLTDVAPVYRGLHPQVPARWADPARARAILPAAIRDDPHARVAFERVTPPNLPAVFGVEDVRSYSFPVPNRYDRYAFELMEVPVASNLLFDDLSRARTLAGLERTCAQWLWTTQRYQGSPLAARVEEVWQHSGRLYVYRLLRASPCAAWHPRDAVTAVADIDTAVARLRSSLGASREEIVIESEGGAASAGAEAGVAAELRWEGPNQLEIALPQASDVRDGWLVLRVSHDAGWSATNTRGEPLRVAPAQLRFLAVEVPAGTEHVSLRYAPRHWRTTLAVAGTALSLLLLTQVWARRSSR